MVQQVEVTGFAELERAMRAFPGKLQRRALDSAVRAGAAVVVKAARAAAPVNTGALKRNLRSAKRRPRRVSAVYAVGVESGKVPQVAADGLTVSSKGQKRRRLTRREKRGDDPYYWKFQELGYTATGRRRLSRRKRHGDKNLAAGGRQIQGKRFLTGALAKNYNQVIETMRVKLSQRIAQL